MLHPGDHPPIRSASDEAGGRKEVIGDRWCAALFAGYIKMSVDGRRVGRHTERSKLLSLFIGLWILATPALLSTAVAAAAAGLAGCTEANTSTSSCRGALIKPAAIRGCGSWRLVRSSLGSPYGARPYLDSSSALGWTKTPFTAAEATPPLSCHGDYL